MRFSSIQPSLGALILGTALFCSVNSQAGLQQEQPDCLPVQSCLANLTYPLPGTSPMPLASDPATAAMKAEAIQKVAQAEADCVTARLNSGSKGYSIDPTLNAGLKKSINDAVTDLNSPPTSDPNDPGGDIYRAQTVGDISYALACYSKNIDDIVNSAVAATAGLNLVLSSSGGAGTALPIPDPNFEIMIDPNLTMPDGRAVGSLTAPGGGKLSKADQARAVISDKFERMVRIFVSGTDQLKLDMPYSAADAKNVPKILGLYQGYMPDLLYTRQNGGILQGAYDPNFGNCGITNPNNGKKKWFKNKDGTYQDEKLLGGKVYSHVCQGGTMYNLKDFYGGRGTMVDMMMDFMAKIRADIVAGKINSPEGYLAGAPDSCMQIRADILANRKIMADPSATAVALTMDGTGRPIREDILRSGITMMNADALNCLDDRSTAPKILGPQQARTCVLAGMQSVVELNMVSNYAYCVWRSVTGYQTKKLIKALLSEEPAPRTEMPRKLACLPPAEHASPSWLALLFGLAAPLAGRRERIRAGASRARLARNSSAILLLLAIVAGSSGCRPKWTNGSCGTGYNAGGWPRATTYTFLAYEANGWQTTVPAPDAHGVLALKDQNGNIRQKSSYSASLVSGAPGNFRDLCDFKCLGLQERIDEYSKTIKANLASGVYATPDRVAEAQARLAQYPGILAAALAACRATTVRVIKGGYVGESMEIADGKCQCEEPDAFGISEPLGNDPQSVFDAMDNQQMVFRQDRFGARQGGIGASPRPDPVPTGSAAQPNYSASIAGGSGTSSSGTETTAMNDAQRILDGVRRARFGQSGAAAFTPTGGGSGLLEFGGKPSLPLAKAATAAKSGTDGAGATYSGGGGATLSTSPNLANDNVNPGGFGENLNVLFGESGGADRVPATADPQDYFTRIGLDESLFKKVEKRYKEKELSWALRDAKEGKAPPIPIGPPSAH